MGAPSLAKKILSKTAEAAEEAALKAAVKVRELSPSNTSSMYEALQSRKNMRLMKDAEKEREFAKTKNIVDEQWARHEAKPPTEHEIKLSREVKASDEKAKLINKYKEEQEASKSKRKLNSTDDEKTVASHEDTEINAAAPATLSAMGTQFSNNFTNPIDIAKSGYDKFEHARQSLVGKIVDLTDMDLNENPHVPQHAKDFYNKAASAIASNATNPLNYVGGIGAADAAIGAASAGYDIYNSRPQTSYVDNAPKSNPTQSIKVKP